MLSEVQDLLAEERNLVVRARQGDQDAFNQLAERYRQRIVSLCCEMLGNVADAEDATQETWRRAWQALGSFRGEARFSTWSWSIAQRVCQNMLRARISALRSKTMSLD